MLAAGQTAGDLLRDIRRRTGLRQAELARRAGVPRSVISAYETGRRQPGVDALERIAESVGLRLTLTPVAPVDHVRAGRILSQVLDLAESLPARRRGPLEYPSLRGLPR